jgi:hypothetical protein
MRPRISARRGPEVVTVAQTLENGPTCCHYASESNDVTLTQTKQYDLVVIIKVQKLGNKSQKLCRGFKTSG